MTVEVRQPAMRSSKRVFWKMVLIRNQEMMRASFGRVNGEEAWLFTLENDEIRVRVTDYGGRLVSVETPDRAGRRGDVVLGFTDATAYAETQGGFGALLGRIANRIAGGVIVVDGNEYQLSTNENGSTLHGGPVGFGRRFWSVTTTDKQALTLYLRSEDGDQGFPGDVEVIATYRIIGPELQLGFDARTSRPTPLSLSAHPYFNLEGSATPDCLDHRVQIYAPVYLPTDRRQIPTGERRPVAETPFDFTSPRTIGERIRVSDPQLRYGRGYDHYFILPDADRGALQLAARVHAIGSGRILEILTTQRGLQFYTGNKLDGSACGREGLYRQSAGFALEPHGFPNAPNQPDFPSTILRPGELYHEEIIYRFRTDREGTAA
jgi:aldose 1-epimerase